MNHTIILYDSKEVRFDTNGIGALSDTISCEVSEERNGSYELQMQYPISGIHYQDIANRKILMVEPGPGKERQPFRIYRISKAINGVATIYANHISYDLSGAAVTPFSATGVINSFYEIKHNSVGDNRFDYISDISSDATMTISAPRSVRSALGGSDGSILDVFGGEYEWDRHKVILHSARGVDSGVTIRYGKNLTDLQQDENISNVITGVLPYWAGQDASIVMLPEKTVDAPGTYDFHKIAPLDMSGEFDEPPSEEELRQKAQQYVSDNRIGVPAVSITVSFQPLEQTEEYKDIALLEKINLCDTVTVEYSELGVSAKAKCVKIVYDAVKGKYTSIVLGDAKANMADTIVDQQKEIEKVPTTSAINQIVSNATNTIVGNKGGYVILNDSDGDKKPDEILVMDTPDIKTATKIWRWNSGGFGYSSNGYNGPYETAITMDGTIVGKFIAGLEIMGQQIISGVIRGQKHPEVYFDLDGGELHCDELVSTTGASDKMSIKISGVTESGYLSDKASILLGNEEIFSISPQEGVLVFNLRYGYHMIEWGDYGWLGVYLPNNKGTAFIIREDKIEFSLPIYDKYGKEIKGV